MRDPIVYIGRMGMLRREQGGRTVFLFAEHVIGRMPSCALMLEASFVSMAHALIRWNGAHWELRDLGSTNGTYVNGARAAVGQCVALGPGCLLTFGDTLETWRLASNTAPAPVAVPLEGGEPCFFSSGAVAIPSPTVPIATIYPEGDGWCLETEDGKSRLSHGQIFEVGGSGWRFECPSSGAATVGSERPIGLDETTLLFGVSRDQEHVWLTLQREGTQKDLGERGCYYLALVLARQRLLDKESEAIEPGWLEVEEFLKKVPEYGSHSALNVEIFRLRRALGEAGLRDASSIVQRRRGQLRIGTDRIEIINRP